MMLCGQVYNYQHTESQIQEEWNLQEFEWLEGYLFIIHCLNEVLTVKHKMKSFSHIIFFCK